MAVQYLVQLKSLPAIATYLFGPKDRTLVESALCVMAMESVYSHKCKRALLLPEPVVRSMKSIAFTNANMPCKNVVVCCALVPSNGNDVESYLILAIDTTIVIAEQAACC